MASPPVQLSSSGRQQSAPAGVSSKRHATWTPGHASTAAGGGSSSKRRAVAATPGGNTGVAEAKPVAGGEEWLRKRHWGSPGPSSPPRRVPAAQGAAAADAEPGVPANVVSAAVAATPAPALGGVATPAPPTAAPTPAAAALPAPSTAVEAAIAAGAGAGREGSPYTGPVDPALLHSPSQRGHPRGGGRSSFHTAGGADAELAAVPGNPLLSNLPSRGGRPGAGGLVRRLSGGIDGPQRMTPVVEAAALEPKELPLHVRAAARDVVGGCSRRCQLVCSSDSSL